MAAVSENFAVLPVQKDIRMEPFNFYGIRKFSNPTSQTERAIEEILISGYSVIPDVLSETELQVIRRKLGEIYEMQAKEIGGEQSLGEINEKNTIRLLLAYDDYFLGLATHPAVLAIIKGLLGDYYVISQQNGIINPPNRENYQTSWHRDLSYQHFVSTRPLAVSALFCVDDFLKETGGTHVLSASHKVEAFPSRDFVEKNQQCISARAGSVLIFDSMLFHRAGYNSSNSNRRALNHFYTLPFIKQQISLPEALKGKYRDDPFLSRFLGYASEPGKSVAEWRATKIERGRNSQ
jgi:ectoine hydroxylase-related dioxygenase (phytanoyl-CoA dioxygenase family)